MGNAAADVSASYGQDRLRYFLDRSVNPSFGPDTVTSFYIGQLKQAEIASDHVCNACPVASRLWLKMLLHRGYGVEVAGGSHTELHGPAVTLVHRLLKNHVTERIGARPYLVVTDAAAAGLGLADSGVAHLERYPDAGEVTGRIVTLD